MPVTVRLGLPIGSLRDRHSPCRANGGFGLNCSLSKAFAVFFRQPLHGAVQQDLTCLHVPYTGKPAAEPRYMNEGDTTSFAVAV